MALVLMRSVFLCGDNGAVAGRGRAEQFDLAQRVFWS
jgi:hypothetical protein